MTMYVRKISEVIKKFINMMSKMLPCKYNENYLIAKALEELLSMYTNSDSNFRKKFYKDENALPILHYIGTLYKEKNKKTLHISSEELILTNSAIKIMYITSQCLEPIYKILYPDGLPDISLNDTIKLQKSLKKLKGILPPLTPEEVYYAFKFLDDIEIRNALSFVDGNAFNKIYKAYEANRKSVFIKEVDEVNNIKLSLYIYISLIRSNKSNSLLKQYLHTIDFNNNLKYQQIMYGFSPSLMKAYKINQDRESFAKMNVSKLIKLHNDVISDYKILINSAISNPDIPLAFREQAKDFWQKRNSVFDDIKVKKNKSKSKELYDPIVLNFIIEGILHAIHKLMQEDTSSDKDDLTKTEKEQEEQVGALESKESKNEEDEQCDINPLGISSLIRTELIGWIQLQENEGRNVPLNKIYRYVLDCLYKLLTGGVVGDISVGEKINCSKEDFLFLLGGSLEKDEETKVNETPTIIWNGEARDMVAFIYAYCGYLSNTQHNLNPSPYKNALGFMCGKTGKRYEKLSGNIRKKEKAYIQAISDWNNRIIDCCNYAKNTFYTRK